MKFLSAKTIIILLGCHELKDMPTKVVASGIKEEASDSEIICYFPTPPSFVGGHKEMLKYISKHLQIDSSEVTPTEKIFVQFYVLKNGAIDEVEILKGGEQCPKLRKNLIRIFEGMPKWNCGDIGNSPKTRMTVPVIVDLE
ncbi:hypothetical protein [Emticicia sp. 17c]|uniref:hypothetical protein n=1 Tax=Emticicia sp. 17c TaxID=3127704 RepID=UPI00301D79DB